MKKLMTKAFTLIELLIVIAIIGVLAVTVILALNPAEAQKKARDTQRLKDANTLQAAVEQLIDSGINIPALPAASLGGANGVTSQAVVGVNSQSCATGNWFGAYDLCPFIKTVPLDPANGQTRNVVTFVVPPGPSTTAPQLMFYRVRIVGANYEIGVRQESIANAAKVGGDGGDDLDWFEIFAGVNTLL